MAKRNDWSNAPVLGLRRGLFHPLDRGGRAKESLPRNGSHFDLGAVSGHKHVGSARRSKAGPAAFLRLRNVRVFLVADRCAGVSVPDERRACFHNDSLFHRNLAPCRTNCRHSGCVAGGCPAINSVPNIAKSIGLCLNVQNRLHLLIITNGRGKWHRTPCGGRAKI